jgi:hypothetical protein
MSEKEGSVMVRIKINDLCEVINLSPEQLANAAGGSGAVYVGWGGGGVYVGWSGSGYRRRRWYRRWRQYWNRYRYYRNRDDD